MLTYADAYVSIRQQTYSSIRQHTSAAKHNCSALHLCTCSTCSMLKAPPRPPQGRPLESQWSYEQFKEGALFKGISGAS